VIKDFVYIALIFILSVVGTGIFAYVAFRMGVLGFFDGLRKAKGRKVE